MASKPHTGFERNSYPMKIFRFLAVYGFSRKSLSEDLESFAFFAIGDRTLKFISHFVASFEFQKSRMERDISFLQEFIIIFERRTSCLLNTVDIFE